MTRQTPNEIYEISLLGSSTATFTTVERSSGNKSVW